MANHHKLENFSIESERAEISRRLRRDALDAMPRDPLEMHEKHLSKGDIALGDDDDWENWGDSWWAEEEGEE